VQNHIIAGRLKFKTFEFKGSDVGAYQSYWVFGLCPVSGIVKSINLDVSETGFVSRIR
jgi:hypothetical protein